MEAVDSIAKRTGRDQMRRMPAKPYNAVRALILQSAVAHQQELGRISFKGAVDLLRQWLPPSRRLSR